MEEGYLNPQTLRLQTNNEELENGGIAQENN